MQVSLATPYYQGYKTAMVFSRAGRFLGKVGEDHFDKFVQSPEMFVKLWDKFRGTNLNLENIFEKFPDPNDFPGFYDNFTEVFIKDGDLLESAGDFLNDIDGDQKLLNLFAGKPEAVKAWDRIRTAAKNANPNLPDPGKILLTDIPSLTALSKFDDALINSIGQQRFDDFLEKLIKANPKCSTCGNAGDALVGNLDNVIEDFHKVVTERAVGPNGGFVQGFEDFMAEAGEQASKAKAAALTLKKMSNNWDELTEGGAYTFKRFEGDIPDIETGHQLDLYFEKVVGNDVIRKSVEMKNWKQVQSISGITFSQFKAYLSSGNKFDYYFSDGLQDGMKNSFQNAFKDSAKATELFNSNPSFFQNLSPDISEVQDLIDLANEDDLIDLINWAK